MWFQKKQKELLPDLPDSGLPKLPEFNFEYRESKVPEFEEGKIPELKISSVPSIPETSQEAIKQEVESEFEKPFNNFSRKIVAEPTEIIDEEKEEVEFQLPRTIEIPEKIKKPVTKKAEPVYIRLDKFKESLELLEDIKTRIQEIEDILDKIKDVRGKEEKELADWEREIQVIKARIEVIDNSVFSQFG